MKSIFPSFLVLLILFGCNANPYPTDGVISKDPAPNRREVAPAFSIIAPAVVEFKEGEAKNFNIQYVIPGNGSPIVEVEGLPTEAVFDKQKGEFSWTPNFEAGNDSTDPNSSRPKSYSFKITLRSSNDPITATSSVVTLLVYNTPRSTELTSNNRNFNVIEGEEFRFNLNVKNDDFPKGPFVLTAMDTLEGLEISPTSNPNIFQVKYKADYSVCNLRNDYYSHKKITFKIRASSPNNVSSETTFETTVYDKRNYAKILAPKNLTVGRDVSILVTALDPNREGVPTLKLKINPTFGEVSEDVIDENLNGTPSITKAFIWKNIPIDRLGSRSSLIFQSCVYDTYYSQDYCTDQTVTINFHESANSPPQIVRSSWPIGKTLYFAYSQNTIKINLPIRDTNSPQGNLKIEIFPEEIRSLVSFINGQLHLKPAKEGMYQFQIQAQTTSGTSTTESFFFEVFAQNRPDKILLGTHSRDSEIIQIKKDLGPGLVVNSDQIEITERFLSQRNWLVVTTNSLKWMDPKIIDELASSIPNLWISTPLIKQLGVDLANELQELGLGQSQRLSQIPSAPHLNSLNLENSSILVSPKKLVKLSGKLTDQSSDPLFLSHPTNSTCKTLIAARGPGVFYQEIAVQCKRKNGGKIVLTGFEWGDLEFNLEDEQVSNLWTKQLLGPN